MSNGEFVGLARETASVAGVLRPVANFAATLHTTAVFEAPMGMSRAEREKLASIEYGAEKNLDVPLYAYPLWSVTDLALTLSGNDGDSQPFTMTTAYRKVAHAFLPAHSFRDTGFLEILGSFDAVDSAAGAIDTYIALFSQDDFPSGLGEPDATAGLPQAETEHVAVHTGALTCPAASAPLRVSFVAYIMSKGHDSTAGVTTWRFHMFGRFTAPVAGVATDYPFATDFTLPFDPTRDKIISLKAKAAALAGTQSLKLRATYCAIKHPMDGTGLDR